MKFNNGGRRMRFFNGNWMMEPDIAPTYATEVTDVTVEPARTVVYTCPVPGMGRRGLGGPMLTLELTAPAENVIGVRLTHFKGKAHRGPDYQLHTEPVTPQVTDGPDTLTFRSGELEATMVKHGGYMGWDMSFTGGGRHLTGSGARSMAYFENTRTGQGFVSQQLDIGVGECLYGLGERFGPFVKNGQVVDMWMGDGGTGSEQAYKNVPFYLSNRGYGVFVNSPSDVSFELATVKVERAMFSVEDETMQYFIIYGETPTAILERYTLLTGRPALPPEWSFGLWLSTSFTTDYDEKTVTGFIQGMADREIPLSVFHFDCYWMQGNHWTDFTWDPAMFPDPAGMLARYKARGLHLCVWINPYIAQASNRFDLCMEKGYLLRRSDGSVWQTDEWQSGMGIVDFTNPEARAWYQGELEQLMEMGVDCFKTDFGERIPVRDVVYYDGSDPLKMHNYYTHLYNQTVFEAIERHNGKGNAVVFARSGTAGTQQFPVHWGGDNAGNYPSMAETLRAGLSLAVSGYGFWSHDIGGFEATAPADLYKRWCAFGLLSSHSRLHGSASYRVPWLFDEEASEVLRTFVNLKCRLMPYLYQHAVYAHEQGEPVIRPMVFEFPNDPAAAYLDRQYMLGRRLLVAPVFSPRGEVEFYVPAGRWIDLLSGEVFEGGCWYRRSYGYHALPLLVRPNTLLPWGGRDDRPDYDYTEGLTLRAFELNELGDSVTIPAADGSPAVTIRARRSYGSVAVTLSRPVEGLTLEIDGRRFPVKGTDCTIPL